MRALLDVNFLVALLDAAHLHHRIATVWLAAHMAEGWGTLDRGSAFKAVRGAGSRNLVTLGRESEPA